ncbi:MAG: NapC/NirT family cytochrome c, partial [Gemmobacter sp.]
MTDDSDDSKRPGRIWRRRVYFGVPIVGAAAAFAAGIIFWGGFNTVVEATNTMPFCISCHEMRDNVYEEYRHTIHYKNRTGVSASCSDCHVPDPWVHKMVRKVQASNELLHKVLGTINTREKFEANRLRMAQNVWKSMKATDSRECRNCHTLDSMAPQFQKPRARQQHLTAMQTGQTCIDCHKGIAHDSVRHLLGDEELERLEAPVAAHIRPVPQTFLDSLAYITELEAAEAAKAAEEARAAEEAAAARIAAAVAAATAAAAETRTDAATPAAAGGASFPGSDSVALARAEAEATATMLRRTSGLQRIGLEIALEAGKSQRRAGTAGGSGRGPVIPGEDIEAQFGDFHRLIEGTPGQRPIDELLTSLSDLQQSLVIAAGTGQAQGTAQMISLIGRLRTNASR